MPELTDIMHIVISIISYWFTRVLMPKLYIVFYNFVMSVMVVMGNLVTKGNICTDFAITSEIIKVEP